MDKTTLTTTATTATETAAETAAETAMDAPAYDGEQLGSLIFDVRADHLAQASGLWVYPASYDDLRLCMRRVEHLSATFSVQFFALHIYPDYLKTGGKSPAISMPGYYPATVAESTAKLRCHIQRAFDRARGMAPRDSAESEA